MKKFYCIALLLSAFVCLAQNRVLIVGDSWAQLQIDNNTHAQIFSDNGFADIGIDPASDQTAEDGTEASDWATPNQLQIIGDAIAANMDIDTVQITLGGNDFLSAWNNDMTDVEQEALQQQIINDLNTIIDFILAQNDKIEVVMSFYDYPNFVDTLDGISGIVCNNLYMNMAEPSVIELNAANVMFEQAFSSVADNNPKVFYVSHLGLMQSFFGFPDEGILPGDILPPGVLDRPSPIESMRDFGLGIRDCFHLSPEGYMFLVQNLFDGYFRDRFDTLFKSSFE